MSISSTTPPILDEHDQGGVLFDVDALDQHDQGGVVLDVCCSCVYSLNIHILGLGSQSRSEPGVFGSLVPEPLEKKQELEPEPLGKKSQEPEPLKKLAGSSALREDKKHERNCTSVTLL